MVGVTASDTINKGCETFSTYWLANFHGNVRNVCIDFIRADDLANPLHRLLHPETYGAKGNQTLIPLALDQQQTIAKSVSAAASASLPTESRAFLLYWQNSP